MGLEGGRHEKGSEKKKKSARDWGWVPEGGRWGRFLRGESILVGQGITEYRVQIWGSGLSKGVDTGSSLVGAEALSYACFPSPSRASGLPGQVHWQPQRWWHCFHHLSRKAVFPHSQSSTSCPFPSRSGPRGNAFILFSVIRTQGPPPSLLWDSVPDTAASPLTSQVLFLEVSVPSTPKGKLQPPSHFSLSLAYLPPCHHLS